jgi:hypothetical protein
MGFVQGDVDEDVFWDIASHASVVDDDRTDDLFVIIEPEEDLPPASWVEYIVQAPQDIFRRVTVFLQVLM